MARNHTPTGCGPAVELELNLSVNNEYPILGPEAPTVQSHRTIAPRRANITTVGLDVGWYPGYLKTQLQVKSRPEMVR